MATDIELAIVKSDVLDDWYTLRRVGVDPNIGEMVPNKYGSSWHMPSRLEPTSCVEGSAGQWDAIATALEHGDSESFKRCAVEFRTDGVYLWSPRNSNVDPPAITVDAAKRLAARIRKVLGGEVS